MTKMKMVVSPATGNDSDVSGTDDPVRMYLREMGSVELLSREGEIAIAKRIEAGREMMIGGICESPLTIRALLHWRDQIADGIVPLRDIIDLEATYAKMNGVSIDQTTIGPLGDEIPDDDLRTTSLTSLRTRKMRMTRTIVAIAM